jgi:ABC-type xylose transport system permease subunit
MPRLSYQDFKDAGFFSAPVIAILLAVVVVTFLLTGRVGIPGPVLWIAALGIVGWFATIRYRRKMEKRLGRKIKGDHELTSISSWMEAESKDEDISKKP